MEEDGVRDTDAANVVEHSIHHPVHGETEFDPSDGTDVSLPLLSAKKLSVEILMVDSRQRCTRCAFTSCSFPNTPCDRR